MVREGSRWAKRGYWGIPGWGGGGKGVTGVPRVMGDPVELHGVPGYLAAGGPRGRRPRATGLML